MNAKAILGLLALGTVALSLRGRRHRSVSGLGAGVRGRPRTNRDRASMAVGDTRNTWSHSLRAMHESRTMKYQHDNPTWSEAKAEQAAWRDIEARLPGYKLHPNYTITRLAGLGLTDEQHGTNRSTLSIAAGFRIRDARRAARNGWCESAATLLRDAEYHAGQVTAHSKSIPGAKGEPQRRKAQALRVAVNRLARDLKQSCSIHRRRPTAGSRRQGKLPFDT